MRLSIMGALIGLVISLALFSPSAYPAHAQQPTGSIPTVTGTPAGPVIKVYGDQEMIGVYAGPSQYDYDRVGILFASEEAPALAYSPDGEWIQIVYLGVAGGKGWVYAPLVSISPGGLPKVAAPPTATPRTTPTIDPAYVEAYGLELEPTHLPTFTQPPPQQISTFASNASTGSAVPFGFIVFGLALVGILGAVISFLRGNR